MPADDKLPEVNGVEAFAHVRHVHPEIPVIMVTGALGGDRIAWIGVAAPDAGGALPSAADRR